MSTVTLGNTIGAAYLGVVAASILYGMTNLQVWMYYQHYPKDWRFQKFSVGLLWILDTLHLSLTIHAVWYYVVDNFANPAALNQIVWSFKLQIAINVIIILVVQCLYAVRVWRLGHHRNPIVPWAVIIIVLVGIVVGIMLAVKTYGVATFDALGTMAWVIYASFAVSTAIDIAIATAICFYLQRSRNGFSATNHKLVTIMKLVLVSGFATSACSMTALITYAAMPHNLVFLGIEFLLTKLYINSFLAMLNTRQSVRDEGTSSVSVSISKIMNMRPMGASASHPATGSTLDSDADDKNVIHLTPLDYHHQLDHDAAVEGSKRGPGDGNRMHVSSGRQALYPGQFEASPGNVV